MIIIRSQFFCLYTDENFRWFSQQQKTQSSSKVLENFHNDPQTMKKNRKMCVSIAASISKVSLHSDLQRSVKEHSKQNYKRRKCFIQLAKWLPMGMALYENALTILQWSILSKNCFNDWKGNSFQLAAPTSSWWLRSPRPQAIQRDRGIEWKIRQTSSHRLRDGI